MLPVFLQMPGEGALKGGTVLGTIQPAPLDTCFESRLELRLRHTVMPVWLPRPLQRHEVPGHAGRRGVELGVGLEGSGWRVVSTVMSKNMRQ